MIRARKGGPLFTKVPIAPLTLMPIKFSWSQNVGLGIYLHLLQQNLLRQTG